MSEDRLDRIEKALEQMQLTLDRHIEFVARSLTASAQQIAKTAAAQEVTEEHLQKLIARVDRHQERLDQIDGAK